jgi:hypothetical protein
VICLIEHIKIKMRIFISKDKRLSIEQGLSILEEFNIYRHDILLPRIDEEKNCYVDKWFEYLKPIHRKEHGWIIKGKYAIQSRVDRKERGIWRPSKPQYIKFTLTTQN